MGRLFRADAADDDLRTIAYQIGVESGRLSVAGAIVDALIDCCEELASLSPMSRLGIAAPELGNAVRLFSFRRWALIFRYVDDDVLILRIADGSQDYLSWKL